MIWRHQTLQNPTDRPYVVQWMVPGGEGEQLKYANQSLKMDSSKPINAIDVRTLSLLFSDQNICGIFFFHSGVLKFRLICWANVDIILCG